MPSIGAHFQTTINDWPNGVAQFPNATWFKSVVDQHLCRDIKAVNPTYNTVFRWPVPDDHYDPFLNRPNLEGARDFFSRFVDGTFLELARGGAFNCVETLNETYGNGQNPDERTAFINFEYDCADVWLELQNQHPELRPIRLCLANTAIGNDIPDEIAALAVMRGHYVGYHPYIPVQNHAILPGEYPNYSGRFEAMDARWRGNGWFVDWLGTEGGPVGYIEASNGDIHLQGGQGWRYDAVCNHSLESLTNVLDYWLTRVNAWNAAHNNRWRGCVLFTSSRLNDQWGYFQYSADELGFIGDYMGGWSVPPPIIPPPVVREYARTVHLLPQNATDEQAQNVLGLAYDKKQSVVWSADDAIMNPDPTQAALTAKHVIVWGDVPGGSLNGWEQWVRDHYPPYPDTMTYRSFLEFEAFRFTHWPTEFRTGGLLGGGLNQLFGTNPERYAPLPGHDGVDFHTVTGSSISAVAGGTVYRVETDPNAHPYGIHVRIDHGNGYKTIYGHLSTAAVIENDIVLGGMIIGYGGSTGNSTGPHLHLAMKASGSTANGSAWPHDLVDPLPYFNEL
jgi:hypothetical protein